LFIHETVLRDEAVEGLAVKAEGVYVDCTLGGAGHSASIAQSLGPKGKLLAIDQDTTAIAHASEFLQPYRDQVVIVKGNFRELKQILLIHPFALDSFGHPSVDGILFDLGVSSPQLDEPHRGFSYQHDAALDMRMDRDQKVTAYELVNEWPEHEIKRIIFEYGEEKFASRIARAIAESRSKAPLRTTGELAELVKAAIPAPARRTGGHPAKRTFQAFRIAVNDELDAFQDALEQAMECVRPGGRIVVITFHSLEDRICKQLFASKLGKCICPPELPFCACGAKGTFKLVNRKPIEPSTDELQINPRARSAKLRIAEKL
jgi:16S rRNA (cytosine1402-N4)-methyltransferase